MAGSSQKFIARNRAPRVQIEYDVELYGAEKKVQLPFVMGVMSDLSGKSEAPQPSVADRKFLEIDVDNFDDRMKSMKPRAAFTVPNTLTGEGNLAVDVTFESMDDFSPAAIARKVEPLRKLLEARTQLSNLMTYMDGKTGAEALLERVLGDRALLTVLAGQARGRDAAPAIDALQQSLAGLPAAEAEAAPEAAKSAFDALKAVAPVPITDVDDTSQVLQALRGAPVPETVEDTVVSGILASARVVAPPTAEAEPTKDVLAGLRAVAPTPAPETDTGILALEALRASLPEDASPAPDRVADALAELRLAAPVDADMDAGGDDVLASLREMAEASVPDTIVKDAKAALDAVRAGLPADTSPSSDALTDALTSLRQVTPTDAEIQADAVDPLATLRDLAEASPPAPEGEDTAAALDGLRAGVSDAALSSSDAIADALTSLRDKAPADAEERPDVPDPMAALRELGEASADAPAADPLDDLLASFDSPAVEPPVASDPLSGLLDSFEKTPETPAQPDPLDDLLASFDTAPAAPDLLHAEEEPVATAEEANVPVGVAAEPDPLDDILAAFDTPATAPPASVPAPVAETDPLDDLLASFDTVPEPSTLKATPVEEPDPLDDLLASFDAGPEPIVEPDPLNDLLAAFDTPAAPAADAPMPDPLDDLLATLTTEPEPSAGAEPDPLADLMSEMAAATPTPAPLVQNPFGTLSAPTPTSEQLRRPVCRMAVLGDFTGRAARGVMETGPALAKRRGIKLDVDTLDRVIEGMATTLVLPVGTDGAGIEVRLASLEDLHPDELYENVELFAELAALRQRLSGNQADAAVREMADWGGRFSTRVQPGYRQSSGSAVPADRKLGDFQRLIGDHEGVLYRPSPASDMIARIVGPHVVAAPSSDVAACKALVDQALSDAMRLVLHHPEFQQIEAQWRTLEFLARRIETDASLQVVLYDISAEELAADLAAGEDLAESGIFGLLADEPLSEGGAGGFSAVFGLYTFEETPPHAELLARLARVAAHVEAPFVTAITPGFLDTPKADRHPLVAAAWEKLRAMPEARYLGVATPRVMLRHPYGKRSEPIERFAFEEFTLSEGLSGMLWGNPAAFVAVLLAAAWTKGGAKMQLGEIMTLGDIPFHTFTDAHGDQVALPCTERNLTLTKMEEVVTRGFMPIVSIRGRDQVRLASFQSLGGGDLRGPWSAAEPRPERTAAPVAQLVVEIPAAVPPVDAAATDDLDALLAGFGNEAAPTDPGAIDADLAALLEGL
jgi:pilus assembly protein FimV